MRRHRLAITMLGIGYLAASFAGLALAPLPDLGSTPAQDSTYLAARQTTPFTAGGVLILLGYLALLAFLVQLADLCDPRPAAPPRALAAAGGTLTLACLAGGLALAGAVVLHRGTLPPPTASALLDAASLATWISTLGLALALAAVGWPIIRTGALPKWTGWSALIIAAGFSLTLPFARTGVGHLPAIAADLWIITTAVVILTRRASTTDAPRTARPARIPAES